MLNTTIITDRAFARLCKSTPLHNLATSGESRRYAVAFTTRVAGGGIWLRQESLKTDFGLPMGSG